MSTQELIDDLEAEIAPLTERLEQLKRQKRDEDSREFIAVNRITRDDVEMSSGEGKPWFGTIWEFGRWMRTRAVTKPWAEWNGMIYQSTGLMSDPPRPHTSAGLVDHLPK